MFRLPKIRNRERTRGQSVVEFALVLPVILLLTLIALDFGRVYLGYINLQSMARIAANFAADNPDALWTSTTDPIVQQYKNQIINDAKATNCTLPVVVPPPTFTDQGGSTATNDLGDMATVGISCSFRLITPIISSIVGTNGNLTVSASAAFPVKWGLSGTSGVVTPAPTSTATVGTCTVPDFAGTSSNDAQAKWRDVGLFTTVVKFQQGNLPWTIASQNQVVGLTLPCDSPITVSKN